MFNKNQKYFISFIIENHNLLVKTLIFVYIKKIVKKCIRKAKVLKKLRKYNKNNFNKRYK